MSELGEAGGDAVEVWQMDDAALAARLVANETARRKLDADDAVVLAQMQNRGTMAEYGYRNIDTLQVDLLHISRREAKKRATRARCLHPKSGVGGNQVPVMAPHAADALAAGAITVEHVDEIVATLAEIPAAKTVEAVEVEKTLVGLAKQADPHAVRKAGQHALALLNPDGPEPKHDEELARPEREFHLQQRRDGRYGLTGILDQETGHTLELLLSPLSKPKPAENGERDVRSPAQRRGDGLAELVQLMQAAVDRPSQGGERPTVVVTMTLEQLAGQATGVQVLDGRPALADGTPITVEQARRIACDAGVIPAVLGGRSELLDLGRRERLATPAQRRALNLRDRGCVKCGRPDKWCQVHHIKHWLLGGDTDLDNMCLLCSECHRLVHHAGWHIVMNRGKPECIPPPWLRNAQTAA